MPAPSSSDANPSFVANDNPELVVAYFDSRFRAILSAMQNEEPQRAAWIEKKLTKELNTTSAKYFAMAWFGLAVSRGHHIRVPVLTRVLVSNLNHNAQVVDFNAHLQEVLDAGSDAPSPIGMVPSYANEWWFSTLEPLDSDLVNFASLDVCLNHHQQELKDLGAPAPAPGATREDVPDTHMTNDCDRCTLYRGVALDAMGRIEQLQHRLRHLEDDYRSKWTLTMRRAAGFNQLYEEALAKEAEYATRGYDATSPATPPVPPPTIYFPAPRATKKSSATTPQPATQRRPVRNSARPLLAKAEQARHRQPTRPTTPPLTKRRLLSILRANAAAELDRASQRPCLKWTWGIDLEIEDISNMRRAADMDYKRPHTGYDESLPSGSFKGHASVVRPHVPGGSRYSTLDELPPPRDLVSPEIPHHFTVRPLRRRASRCFVHPQTFLHSTSVAGAGAIHSYFGSSHPAPAFPSTARAALALLDEISESSLSYVSHHVESSAPVSPSAACVALQTDDESGSSFSSPSHHANLPHSTLASPSAAQVALIDSDTEPSPQSNVALLHLRPASPSAARVALNSESGSSPSSSLRVSFSAIDAYAYADDDDNNDDDDNDNIDADVDADADAPVVPDDDADPGPDDNNNDNDNDSQNDNDNADDDPDPNPDTDADAAGNANANADEESSDEPDVDGTGLGHELPASPTQSAADAHFALLDSSSDNDMVPSCNDMDVDFPMPDPTPSSIYQFSLTDRKLLGPG